MRRRRIRRRQSGQRPIMFCAVACRARQCCARRARRSASRWSSTALSCDPPALPPLFIERWRRRRRRWRRLGDAGSIATNILDILLQLADPAILNHVAFGGDAIANNAEEAPWAAVCTKSKPVRGSCSRCAAEVHRHVDHDESAGQKRTKLIKIEGHRKCYCMCPGSPRHIQDAGLNM